MARKRLPWFKVQSRLTSHPKFQCLSPSQRGNLLSLWCCASDQPERGKLPSIPEIAYHLGSSYQINPNRVRVILAEFTGMGWLDHDPSTGVYRVHDWGYWQAISGVFQQNDQQFDQQFDQQSVGADVENKEVTAKLGVPRYTDSKNQSSLRYDCSVRDKAHAKHVKGSGMADDRYLPVKRYMEAQYLEWRGRSLGADTLAKDWVRFAAMLHRTKTDPVYSVSGIQAAFLRWVSSTKPYDKYMSIAQWADSIHRYMASNGSESVQPASVQARSVQRAIRDEDLEWWKG